MKRTVMMNGKPTVVWFEDGRVLMPLWFWDDESWAPKNE